jgi:hypothetical protein
MATATASKTTRHFGAGVVRRPKGTPAPTPPPDRTGLVLEIRGVSYRLARVRPKDPEILAAWSVRKVGSTEPYTVHVDAHGTHCTCGAGVFRHEGTAGLCKHARSLKAWGLLP